VTGRYLAIGIGRLAADWPPLQLQLHLHLLLLLLRRLPQPALRYYQLACIRSSCQPQLPSFSSPSRRLVSVIV
jgi:hypothetical protein